LLEEKQEKLCIKVLQTLKDMMSFEMELGMKVLMVFSHADSERVYSRVRAILVASVLQ